MTPAPVLPAVSLPVVALPSTPEDSFRCEHFKCVLPARDCIARQSLRKKRNGESSGKRWSRVYVPLRLQYCASGTCEQGKGIEAAVGPKSEGAAA